MARCIFLISCHILLAGFVISYKKMSEVETQVGNIYNDYTMRLVDCDGKETYTAGRVEIFYHERWGTVCGDQFDNAAAQVVCYSLGYNRSRAMSIYETFGGSTQYLPIIAGVDCTGNEQHIDHCEHEHYELDGVPGCSNDKDISVACLPYDMENPGYQARVVDGTDMYNGRLEVEYNGVWGTICDYQFSNVSATVGCKTILRSRVNAGFIVSGHWIKNDPNCVKSTNDTQPIQMGWVNCTGNELNIGSCPHTAWGVHTCNHLDDVCVYCTWL